MAADLFISLIYVINAQEYIYIFIYYFYGKYKITLH